MTHGTGRSAFPAAALAGLLLLAGAGPSAGETGDVTPAGIVAPQEATMPSDTSRSIGGVRFSDSLGQGSGPTGEELDALTARVAAQLRCPVCRNQSVVESSATLSQQMQAEIRRRLAAGESPEEVKQYFVGRYGEWILLQPRAEGINLLVYVLPALALLGGLVLVWLRIRQWTRGEEAGDAATAPAGGTTAPTPDSGPDRAGTSEADRADGSAPERDGRSATGDPGDGDDLSDRERQRLDELIREGS